ncbi:unnamed protein product [Rotaria sordida]|uniref:Uncharacterized protein n=1 Tax=Rotaria sordida TaxID=392033 RepID=A0A815XX13_9BILA|nr:unnamed protein product [Rotaria sordida]CAF1562599.1 unnamed protein product [Rotaria sordida]
MFRQWKNRLQCSNTHQTYLSIDNELENVYHKLDKLFNENLLLKIQIDKLEGRHEHWIMNEQIYLLKRIEKLENENCQLREIYQTYQIQNEKCIRSITDLIIKILLTQQELRKQHTANDTTHWRKKQQKNESFSRNTISISCPMSYNQSDNSEHITNNKSICSHQQSMIVEDQDQKTTNQSSGLNNTSSKLTTIKSKSNKSSTSSTNKLYFVLNNEKTSVKSIQNNCHSSKINIIPIDDSHHKQQLSTLNKNQQQTKTTYSNHEKSSIQTSNRTTTSISKPSRVRTKKKTNNRQRPPIPSITNQKTIHKSSRPPFTSTKPTESFPSVRITSTRPQSGSIITKITTTNNNKPPTSSVVRQPAHVLIAEQQNNNTLPPPTIVLPSSSIINNGQHVLFSKDTVKRIRPVRSHELKLFSNHLTPEILSQTNESLSTLTPSSLESIINNKSIDNQLQKTNNNNTNLSSNISSDMRDFSEDSLNEHEHIQRLLKQNASINTTKNTNKQTHSLNDTVQNENIEEEYFLSIDNNRSSSLIKSRSISLRQKSLVHRLIFPQRLGRMIFYRRILSDSDIYQKLCSKDNEIYHNVYHLDTIRDYSMEFYMLTSYASDSELRAWIDSNDDEIVNNVCRMNKNDDDDDEIPIKTIHSQDSLNQNEELDWYSELEIVHLPLNNQQENHKNISNYSNKVHDKELLHNEQFPLTTISTDLISSSSILSNDTSNKHYSTSLPSNIPSETNLLLQEIFRTSCTRCPSISNTIEQQTHIDQCDNDSTSSIITEEFKPDFYYLCPITNTTNFSKTDYKPLFHDF